MKLDWGRSKIHWKIYSRRIWRASEKALRTVPPTRSQDITYLRILKKMTAKKKTFWRQRSAHVDILLRVYLFQIEVSVSGGPCDPLPDSRRNVIFAELSVGMRMLLFMAEQVFLLIGSVWCLLMPHMMHTMRRGEVKGQIILCLNFFLPSHKYEFIFIVTWNFSLLN